MGVYFMTAACFGCKLIFSFNPHKVPSYDEPICRACVDRVNPLRIANGLPPIVPLPGAYEAVDEGRGRLLMATYLVPAYKVGLVRDGSIKLTERPIARTPAESARILRAYMPDTGNETFAVAFLDVRHRLTGLVTVSTGCLTTSLVHPREVFAPAITAKAAAIILCHNHPSGDPEPSGEDLAVTRRIAAAGELLGIEVLDHVILGDGTGRHVSLKERGVL